MRVWIIQTAEPMHIDHGSVRSMRAMNLADALVDSGHEVIIWTSAFMHSTKTHRTRFFKTHKINSKLNINLIPSIGYKKNISIKRIIDHIQLALNLRFRLKNNLNDSPDIVFIGYPPIEISFLTVNLFSKKNIPTVVDVKDLWPTIFLEFCPDFFRPILRIILSPYYFMAKSTFKKVDYLSAMSQEYIDWIHKFSKRKSKNIDLITPLTSKLRNNSALELFQAEKWWSNFNVSKKNIRRFCFVGYFNSMYDFKIIKELALKYLEEKVDCQFVLCGSGGEAFVKVKKLFSGIDNVIFPGWIDPPKIEYLSQCCVGSIMPYKNIENFKLNITNKVSDSLAYGLPIITTLEGALKKLIEENEIGFYCSEKSKEDLYSCSKLILDNKELRKKFSFNARKLYIKNFECKTVYDNLVHSLERITKTK